MTEALTFEPSRSFRARANAAFSLYDDAARDREAFWAEQASRLSWTQPWSRVLDWDNPPNARWFVEGQLNVAYNCVDRHVEAGHGAQVALHWVGEPGDTRDITYSQLQDEVSKAANALASLGLMAGDRVVIQLPMIPEAVISMLACARLGLVHSVVFGGFSAAALRSRIDDAQARVVITSDGQYRRGEPAPMKENVDEALVGAETVERVIVVHRVGSGVAMDSARDVWWHDLVESQSTTHVPESFDSEHPLFILYTSGTTGKPKGITHTTGGYLTQAAYTHWNVFDLKPDTDVYWCAADVGWITGHSYIVYGPLANRVTQVMYEGTPNTPHHLLHRSDSHSHVHEMGRAHSRGVRSEKLATARKCRRTDQPGSVALVPQEHRWGLRPDCRHLVADRDGRDHDCPAAGSHDDQAGFGSAAATRNLRAGRR
jgi:acetyl-CoA synthetase